MSIIEEICTITTKGQTTVPKSIRQALGVGYGGRIAFRMEEGIVTVRALPENDNDPALEPFLNLLAADLAARPGDAVQAIPPGLVSRLEKIANEAGKCDPDAPIEGDVVL